MGGWTGPRPPRCGTSPGSSESARRRPPPGPRWPRAAWGRPPGWRRRPGASHQASRASDVQLRDVVGHLLAEAGLAQPLQAVAVELVDERAHPLLAARRGVGRSAAAREHGERLLDEARE